ncbi:hypothetical protein HII31_12282 [Pseudocercospora fuligena]|uniref:Uncharacterized protein n=1 Tax=Pseudocercospora fuligena TaxID=685502 RepID=A0A8H6RA89_9PEZI|nr:hypothetical protein HII31_12282 [Pseudocercospora fuligena]
MLHLKYLMMYADCVLLCGGVSQRGCRLSGDPRLVNLASWWHDPLINVAVVHLVLIVCERRERHVRVKEDETLKATTTQLRASKAQRVHNQLFELSRKLVDEDGIVSRTTMILTARREANELAKDHQVTNNHVQDGSIKS